MALELGKSPLLNRPALQVFSSMRSNAASDPGRASASAAVPAGSENQAKTAKEQKAEEAMRRLKMNAAMSEVADLARRVANERANQASRKLAYARKRLEDLRQALQHAIVSGNKREIARIAKEIGTLAKEAGQAAKEYAAAMKTMGGVSAMAGATASVSANDGTTGAAGAEGRGDAEAAQAVDRAENKGQEPDGEATPEAGQAGAKGDDKPVNDRTAGESEDGHSRRDDHRTDGARGSERPGEAERNQLRGFASEVRKVLSLAKQLLERAKAALEKETDPEERKENRKIVNESRDEIAKAEKSTEVDIEEGETFLSNLGVNPLLPEGMMAVIVNIGEMLVLPEGGVLDVTA